LLILHLALVGLFLLDLALPRNVPLLPYYGLVVALSASFAVPRQMLPLILQAYGLAIASGLFWGFIPSIDFSVRLLGLSGVVLVAVFLAAQRQRELADRRRSEEVLQLTLDNASAGIGVTDAEGQFIRVNPAFCTLLGVDPASITTLRWQDLSTLMMSIASKSSSTRFWPTSAPAIASSCACFLRMDEPSGSISVCPAPGGRMGRWTF
jgi:PAS domain-containing protein